MTKNRSSRPEGAKAHSNRGGWPPDPRPAQDTAHLLSLWGHELRSEAWGPFLAPQLPSGRPATPLPLRSILGSFWSSRLTFAFKGARAALPRGGTEAAVGNGGWLPRGLREAVGGVGGGPGCTQHPAVTHLQRPALPELSAGGVQQACPATPLPTPRGKPPSQPLALRFSRGGCVRTSACLYFWAGVEDQLGGFPDALLISNILSHRQAERQSLTLENCAVLHFLKGLRLS